MRSKALQFSYLLSFRHLFIDIQNLYGKTLMNKFYNGIQIFVIFILSTFTSISSRHFDNDEIFIYGFPFFLFLYFAGVLAHYIIQKSCSLKYKISIFAILFYAFIGLVTGAFFVNSNLYLPNIFGVIAPYFYIFIRNLFKKDLTENKSDEQEKNL